MRDIIKPRQNGALHPFQKKNNLIKSRKLQRFFFEKYQQKIFKENNTSNEKRAKKIINSLVNCLKD